MPCSNYYDQCSQSVNASFKVGARTEGWGTGKTPGIIGWSASISWKVIEQLILGILSKNTKDKKIIRKSQDGFTKGK